LLEYNVHKRRDSILEKINIALVGYGNVGRGAEAATKINADTKLVAVLTRRPKQVRKELKDVPVFHADEITPVTVRIRGKVSRH